MCAPLMLDPDRASGSRRLLHLIEFLQQDGWDVSFYAQNALDTTEPSARRLRQMGVPVYAGDYSAWAGDAFTWDMDRLIASARFDLVIIAHWYLAERFLAAFRDLSPATTVIVDSIDLHFLRLARKALREAERPARSTVLDATFAAEFARELNTYVGADAVLTVSRKEADLLNEFIPGPPLAAVVPDCEDLDQADVPFGSRRGLLFVGNFRHPPNAEAVEYLIDEILPRVDLGLRREHPVYIVGDGLDEEMAERARHAVNVRVIGWAPSVLPYLHQTRVSLLPLLHGAGTKRKLIEALMTGTPCVSTSVGAEGMALRHDEHLLIADTADAFARGIEALLCDAALWQRLVAAGRRHVVDRHGREAARRAFRSALAAILPPASAPPAETPARKEPVRHGA